MKCCFIYVAPEHDENTQSFAFIDQSDQTSTQMMSMSFSTGVIPDNHPGIKAIPLMAAGFKNPDLHLNRRSTNHIDMITWDCLEKYVLTPVSRDVDVVFIFDNHRLFDNLSKEFGFELRELA